MDRFHRPHILIIVAIAFLLGAASGVLFQRAVGIGSALRSVGLMPRFAAQPTRPAPGLPDAFHGNVSLFVLAGQSNMAGWAELPETQTLHPRAYVLGNDYVWRPASEPLDDPTAQVDPVSRGSGRMGPGVAFAKTLVEANEDLVVGLIPCAKGDTTIREWQRALADDTLYGSCLKRVRAASLMGKVRAVLFFQGEADALDPQKYPDRQLSADNYGHLFIRYITDLRADLGQPTLPVVYAQIGSHAAPEDFVNWSLVQDQQAEVELACATMIMTDDLPRMDAVHYTQSAYQVIGRRFAQAYLALVAAETCGV